MYQSGRTISSEAHTRDRAAAAVARRDQGFVAIGIDLEPATALPSDLCASICTSDELERVTANCDITPGLAVHLIFCMKEAAFKCQYTLSSAMLGIPDFTIDVDAEAGAFTAFFRKVVRPFDIHQPLRGRYAIAAGHIASTVVLTSEQAP